MVILIDGAAHRTQGIVAVGERIGERKFTHTAGPRRLDDADIGDVVRDHGVKTDVERARRAPFVVRGKNGIRQCSAARFFFANGGGLLGNAVYKKDAFFCESDHGRLLR